MKLHTTTLLASLLIFSGAAVAGYTYKFYVTNLFQDPIMLSCSAGIGAGFSNKNVKGPLTESLIYTSTPIFDVTDIRCTATYTDASHGTRCTGLEFSAKPIDSKGSIYIKVDALYRGNEGPQLSITGDITGKIDNIGCD